MQNCQFLLKLLFISQIFPDIFLIINVQEDPKNNKSIEFGLTIIMVKLSGQVTPLSEIPKMSHIKSYSFKFSFQWGITAGEDLNMISNTAEYM